MSDTREKQFVRDLVHEHTGLVLKDLVTTNKKTPDFATETVVGEMVVELKNLKLTDPSHLDGWESVPSKSGGLCRRADNGAARIARCIKSAYQQLVGFARPRALILLNDSALDFLDLKSVFTGGVEYSNQIVDTSARRVALGDTIELREAIDLYIWIDRTGAKVGFAGYYTSELGRRVVEEHLPGSAAE